MYKNRSIRYAIIILCYNLYRYAYFIYYFLYSSRVKEIDNEHKRGLQQQWIDKNNNGINDLEEGYVEEEFNTDDCNHYNEDDITEDFKNID